MILATRKFVLPHGHLARTILDLICDLTPGEGCKLPVLFSHFPVQLLSLGARIELFHVRLIALGIGDTKATS